MLFTSQLGGEERELCLIQGDICEYQVIPHHGISLSNGAYLAVPVSSLDNIQLDFIGLAASGHLT